MFGFLNEPLICCSGFNNLKSQRWVFFVSVIGTQSEHFKLHEII